jgi:hypothetical protein
MPEPQKNGMRVSQPPKQLQADRRNHLRTRIDFLRCRLQALATEARKENRYCG